MENNLLAIAYNQVMPNAKPDELDVLDEVKLVRETAEKMGYRVAEVPVSMNLREARDLLVSLKPFLIFNIVESIENIGDLIFFAPALFSSLGIPYTGTKLESMFITSNKVLAKKEMLANKLPTAAWFEPQQVHRVRPDRRYILKPIWEEGSLGLDEENVFWGNNDAMKHKISRLSRDKFFVEEYIHGREFNVSVLAGENGPEVMPPAEMQFIGFPDDKPKVMGYTAKWVENSFEYHNTRRTFELKPEDEKLKGIINQICFDCWKIFDLRGHVRVDMRFDENTQPYILEINTNPCITRGSGFYTATEYAGYSFDKVLERIIKNAIQ